MFTRTTHVTLLERLSQGEDRNAWREFCDRYGDLVRGFARRAGCSENDADDVLQDVLAALLSVMPSFRYDPERGRFRGYLKTIVVRLVHRRRCQKQGAASLEGCGGDAGAPPALHQLDAVAEAADPAAEDLWKDIWEAEWRQYHMRIAMHSIDAEFSVHDRAAFQRYAVEGRSAADTATTLGITVDQVYQAKSRILRRLGELVAQQVADEG